MSDLILEDWLTEQDIPPLGGQPDAGMGPGGANPLGTGAGGFSPEQSPETMPPANQPGITNQGLPEQPPDVTQDPQAPDMPEEKDKMGFDEWRDKYFKDTVKGDPNELLEKLKHIRNRDLELYEKKFVEDNIQVQYLRQNANVKQASDKLRKLLREDLDENNPATSITNHMHDVLSTMPELSNVFIKITGLLGAKGDAHRKYIAGLIGGVQVGAGSNTDDVIFNEREFAIGISTRFNAELGDVPIGKWALREDDPEKYLEEPELERLEQGSPEEKEVLRKRIVMESIAEKYGKRAFIINVVGEDGTVYTIGWDLSNCLKVAYKEGKFVVKTIKSENSEAMIDDNGAIVAYLDLKIDYLKPTGSLDAEGNKEMKEMPFFERRDGMLFLLADVKLLKEAATTLPGLVIKEIPYRGNPSDLRALARSVPDITELLLRNP
jgi:hypothetical protein